MAAASSCCVMGRPRPRKEPSTERRERSLLPRVIEEPTYCNLQIAYYFSLFVSRTIFVLFSATYRHYWEQFRPDCGKPRKVAGERLIRFAQRLQINSELLALLIKVAALQT